MVPFQSLNHSLQTLYRITFWENVIQDRPDSHQNLVRGTQVYILQAQDLKMRFWSSESFKNFQNPLPASSVTLVSYFSLACFRCFLHQNLQKFTLFLSLITILTFYFYHFLSIFTLIFSLLQPLTFKTLIITPVFNPQNTLF